MSSFEDLDVWRRSCDLSVHVCDALKNAMTMDSGIRLLAPQFLCLQILLRGQSATLGKNLVSFWDMPKAVLVNFGLRSSLPAGWAT
jgi:hypothetical protein